MRNFQNSIINASKKFSMLRLATILPICEDITGIYPDMKLPVKECFESFYNAFNSAKYKELFGKNPTKDDKWDLCIEFALANLFKHIQEDACLLLDYMDSPKLSQQDLDNINVEDYHMANTDYLSWLKHRVSNAKLQIKGYM